MSTGLFILVWSACSAVDPKTAAAIDYLETIRPLMLENSLLADRLLVQAAGVYNETTTPSDVAASWEQEIVPLSEHLADQASLVSPPPTWADRHAELVTIWTDRAVAYRAVSEAIRSGDAERWNPARRDAEATKIREETWFNRLNEQVIPLGIPLVDEYP